MIAPHIFNPKIMTLTEVFWWVKPEHRGSRAGRDLIEEFILWGKENVDWIITTLEENSPVNDSVFLNRGFKPKERSFIMEVT